MERTVLDEEDLLTGEVDKGEGRGAFVFEIIELVLRRAMCEK